MNMLRNYHFLLASALAVAPTVVGCAADSLDTTADVQQVAAQQQVEESPTPVLRNFSYRGSLCPPDTMSIRSNEGTGTFTATSSTQIDGFEGAQTKECAITFEAVVPRGLVFTKPSFAVSAFAQGKPAMLEMSVATGNAVSRATTLPRQTLRPEVEEVVYFRPGFSGSGCGANQSVLVTIKLRASVPADAMLTIPDLNGSFNASEGTEWRTCAGVDVIGPAPKGTKCMGLSNRKCAAPYRCDIGTDLFRTGICVDASERLPPQPAGATCGGLRKIACQAPDVVCNYQRAEDVGLRSICQPANASAVGDYCGGTPAVRCPSQTACIDNHCALADGSFTARCGAGLPACGSGLECDGAGECKPTLAAVGAPCDGPMSIRCQRGAVCDADTQVCMAARPGEAGATCGSLGGTCNAGLTCSASNVCR